MFDPNWVLVHTMLIRWYCIVFLWNMNQHSASRWSWERRGRCRELTSPLWWSRLSGSTLRQLPPDSPDSRARLNGDVCAVSWGGESHCADILPLSAVSPSLLHTLCLSIYQYPNPEKVQLFWKCGTINNSWKPWFISVHYCVCLELFSVSAYWSEVAPEHLLFLF